MQTRENPQETPADPITIPRQVLHEAAAGRLRRLIVDQAGLILRRAIDPDRSFAEHGLDSLGMLELRTSVETQTGIRISPKTIVSYNTARSLAAHLSESLAEES